MPRKSDSIPIRNESLDRRVKLTKEDKELISELRETQGKSYNWLAKEFGVSKRLIIFICKPETQLKNLEERKARGGSKQYYDREKHTVSMKEHRNYKKELFIKGLIK